MWKNLVGTSLVIVSIAFLVDSISSAKASLGPAVSSAANPIFSGSDYCSSNSSMSIAGQSGQEIIVTDVTISAQTGQQIEIVFTSAATGVEIGRYKTWNIGNAWTGSAIIDTHLNSGLRLPTSEDLLVSVNGNGSYTFSGYYAHP